jgi:hypothetical protein
VDDVTERDIQGLIDDRPTLSEWQRRGRLRLTAVESDLGDWDAPLVSDWKKGIGYIAKGMRRLNQLFSPAVTLPGLHVVVNKGDTAGRIILDERGVSLPKDRERILIFLFKAPSSHRSGRVRNPRGRTPPG